MIFRDFVFSLMCTGRLQVEGQFENGEVGEDVDPVEGSSVS